MHSHAIWSGVVPGETSRSPLFCALSEVSEKLRELPRISPESSVASAICEMVDAKVSRLYLRGEDATVGVVRATDVLMLLLKEQQRVASEVAAKARGK